MLNLHISFIDSILKLFVWSAINCWMKSYNLYEKDTSLLLFKSHDHVYLFIVINKISI